MHELSTTSDTVGEPFSWTPQRLPRFAGSAEWMVMRRPQGLPHHHPLCTRGFTTAGREPFCRFANSIQVRENQNVDHPGALLCFDEAGDVFESEPAIPERNTN